MKPDARDSTLTPTPGSRALKRRGLLLGVGAAGAAALAARALPVAPEAVAASAQPAADTSAGYRLTQHVLRYYETTKV